MQYHVEFVNVLSWTSHLMGPHLLVSLQLLLLCLHLLVEILVQVETLVSAEATLILWLLVMNVKQFLIRYHFLASVIINL